jgi:bifunctional UDP-N-acetylglucosamine pyrophosphorylase / glucosamine-1-phosphate N-acetyltransferase
MKNNLFSTIILAAGSGTRMKASLPKVLHRIGGQTMIGHLLDTLHHLGSQSTCLVTAPGMEEVRDSFPGLEHSIQEKPLGTAHAVLAATSFIEMHKQDLLVLYGDVPLVTPNTLKKVISKGTQHEVVLLAMEVEEENAYGRVLLTAQGNVEEIVETKDCTPAQCHITLCSSGIFFLRHEVALPLLRQIKNENAQKEFYLPDIVRLAQKAGYSVGLETGVLEELQGINSQAELARAEKIFQKRKREEFLATGVTFLDPETVYMSYDTKIAPNVFIEPNVFMGPGVVLREGVKIKAFSHLEGAEILENAVVGPFARVRPGTLIGKKSKVGNFVEIKKSTIGEDTKISHLSYIGDAIVGEKVNVGAGTITCNYDGYQKHKTVIEEGVFVGSNTALVAPVTLGKESMIGAGSVITQDVPERDIAVARAPQKNIRDGSKRFRARYSKK